MLFVRLYCTITWILLLVSSADSMLVTTYSMVKRTVDITRTVDWNVDNSVCFAGNTSTQSCINMRHVVS